MGSAAVTGFFFAQSPRPLAITRITVGLVLLYDAAVRWPYAIELYSSVGLPAPVFPGTLYEPPALGATLTVMLHSLLVFALAAVVVGWQTRLSLITAFVLSAWFGLLDGPGTFKKYSVISLHLLLLLSLTRPGAVWSLDRWWAGSSSAIPLAAAWPRRLMQLLLASVYFGAALTKLRLPEFATGDLLEFALLDDAWGGNRLGMWLSTQPRLLAIAALLTILLELLFPFLVWTRHGRRPLLVVMVLFHVTLGAIMHLGIFSALMIAALAVFLTEHDLQWLPSSDRPLLRQHRARLLWVSAASYLCSAVAIALAGWGVQRQADWYGVFQQRGAVPFSPVATEEFVRMMAAQKPALADQIHRVDLGSRISLSSLQVYGTRDEFQRGMTVHGLARLLLNHEPLELDWILLGPDGLDVARTSHRVAPAITHATAAFRLTDDAPPGRYRLLLQADGLTVADRAFHVTGNETPSL